MPKANEVATELRKLADALDREPETELVRGNIVFNCKYMGGKGKPIFLALARILPHPLTKGTQAYDNDAMELSHKTAALVVSTGIERSLVCKIVTPEKIIPAVYDCVPLLSEAEDAALTEA
jgi:hypothetical protein